jgi:hypothetical protein
MLLAQVQIESDGVTVDGQNCGPLARVVPGQAASFAAQFSLFITIR